jgi:dihydrofolate reductase
MDPNSADPAPSASKCRLKGRWPPPSLRQQGVFSYEGAFIDVRHAPVATKFRFAPKCRDVPKADVWLLVAPVKWRANCVQSHFCTTSAQAILKSLGWRFCSMAKLVFGMNQSLDGYVDHMAFAPSPTLFRHFIEEAQGQAGSVYGRQMYEVMRYWDDDHPEWDAEEHAFAAAWRNQPKWVVSRSLKSVGPNARLVEDDLEGAIRELKAERDGEIEVAGPDLAQSLTELGLIDEYRIYLHPVVLGHGKPYFAGPRPPLRLMANDRIGEDVIRLTYIPA